MNYNFKQGDNVAVLHNLQKTFEKYGSATDMPKMSGKIFKLTGIAINSVYIEYNGYRYRFANEDVQKIHENITTPILKPKKIEIFNPINLDLS
ncbi:MAG: hypothetical protein ACTSWK_00230 [Promethearchaeota archaeon]